MIRVVRDWSPLISGVIILILALMLAEHHPLAFFISATVICLINAAIVVADAAAQIHAEKAARQAREAWQARLDRDHSSEVDRG